MAEVSFVPMNNWLSLSGYLDYLYNLHKHEISGTPTGSSKVLTETAEQKITICSLIIEDVLYWRLWKYRDCVGDHNTSIALDDIHLTPEDVGKVKSAFRIVASEQLISYFPCTLHAHLREDAFVMENGVVCLFDSHICFFKRVPEENYHKEGFLDKRSQKVKTLAMLIGHTDYSWSRYYWCLDSDRLTYYFSESDKDKYTTLGIIPLQDIHSVVTADEAETQRKHSFQILTSTRLYYLSCTSEADMNEWIEAIKQCVSRKNGTTKPAENVTLHIPIEMIKEMKKFKAPLYPRAVSISTEKNEVRSPCHFSSDVQFIFSSFKKSHRSSFFSGLEGAFSRVDRSSPMRERKAQHKYNILNISGLLRLSPNLGHSNNGSPKESPSTDQAVIRATTDSTENTEFHHIFNLGDSEQLIKTFFCAMSRTMLIQGKLYISQNYVCFYAKYLQMIRKIRKQYGFDDTLLTRQFTLSSFLHRTEVMHVLESCWKGSEGRQPALNISTCDEESFEQIGSPIPQKGLRVTILIVGSRGDVQPFISLAIALEKIGHKVRIATHEAHRKFVSDWNVEFCPLAGDPRELMKLCVENDMFTISFMREGYAHYLTFVEELLTSTWNACKDSTDVIIQNPPAMGGPHIAEKLGIPIFGAFTMPWSRTTEVPHPFAVPAVKMGPVYNYTSYVAVDQGMWIPLAKKFNNWRKEVLGLPALELKDGGSILHTRQIPYMYCWSPTVLPKPADWPEYISVTGYWFLDSPSTWKPPSDLIEFLAKEPKPIYIGFGSVTVSDPDGLTKTIVDSLVKTGQRAVLVKGWGGLGNVEYPDNIYALDSVPHDWLFPQLAAVVHHGGAGTTAAGLRAGVPTLVVPFFGDQFFWGQRVYEMGVGVAPITVKKLTVDSFSSAIVKLTSDDKMRAHATDLGKHIREQDGVARAVDFFQRQLKRFPKTKSSSQANLECLD